MVKAASGRKLHTAETRILLVAASAIIISKVVDRFANFRIRALLAKDQRITSFHFDRIETRASLSFIAVV
jgi:hypothetical protein